MKKTSLFVLLACCAALIFSSCASIPKKAKPGDTLVIGRAEVYSHDYISLYGVKVNGELCYNIEITIKDMIHGGEKIIRTNEEGFFCIKGLKPAVSYGITKVLYKSYGSDGAWFQNSVLINNPETFIPYDNMVLNLGTTHYDFDGKKNWVTWRRMDTEKVKKYFLDLHEEEDSEWFNKEIIDW
ncbi:MAG: hypothetical protein K6G09_04435 [Treponema sp.]|nr:hypothetical protein [Treponema sp.]